MTVQHPHEILLLLLHSTSSIAIRPPVHSSAHCQLVWNHV